MSLTGTAADGVLVLADDLTSAAEAGGHAASVGRRATVVVWDTSKGSDWPSAGQDQDLVECLDLNTRALDAASAARAHATALGMVDARGRTIYKTVDSSLRGNWAEEIAATLMASNRRTCVLAPAYPEFDRHTRSGVQFVSGVPTNEGPAGTDPVRPVTEARICVPLAAAGLGVARVSAQENLQTVLATAMGMDKDVRTVVVVDAWTPEHLANIARTVEPFGSEIVVAGSPGLFEALLPSPPLGRLHAQGGRNTHTLTAVGSLHPSSRAQVHDLERRGIPVVTVCANTPASTLTSELDAIFEARGHAVVVTSPSSAGPSPLPVMSEAVADIACGPRDVGLVLVGGDTARSVLVDAQVRAITASGVVTPGVAVLQLTLPLGRRQIITKAGGLRRPEPALPLHPSVDRRSLMTDSRDTRPKVAVTMGDPSGIGPEIVVGALGDGSFAEQVNVIVIGDLARLQIAAKLMHVDLPIVSESESLAPAQEIRVREVTNLPEDLPFGIVSAAAGAASFAYLREAIKMSMSGEVEAIVTAPIHKEAWRAAGVEYPDHTSALADLSNSERHAMMLANDELRTVLVTTHLPLVEALAAITQERVHGIIELAHDELRAQGIEHPRIAVAGVNPHAGEGGMFGHEESEAIAPGNCAGTVRRYQRDRPAAARHRVHACPTRRVRCRGRAVSRSGVDPRQAPGHRRRRERDPRPSVRADQCGPRNRL